MNMWGGRFRSEMNDDFKKFNETFSIDHRLLEADLLVSEAYVQALLQVGLLTLDESDKIKLGLENIRLRAKSQPEYVEQAKQEIIEDVHTFVEQKLFVEIGELAFKLNTGRSRNEQIATDLRIWLREKSFQMTQRLTELQGTLISLSEKFFDVVIPGYTHLQRAQPILWAHYLLAYFEMFERDKQRLLEAQKRLNVLPLGSGALAGNSFGINRHWLAEKLGFDQISKNSLDAVSDRDFVIEFTGILSLVFVHLSRIAEDLILYSSAEFGFIELSDSFSTGSSLLPQKKNPDGLELIRGKSGRVFGNHIQLLTLMKGLPLSYNKDMAEDKGALFDSIDTFNACTKVLIMTLQTLSLNIARINQANQQSTLYATDLAEYLVRKGISFRESHHTVGKVVAWANKHQKELSQLSLTEFQTFDNRFDSDLFLVFSSGYSLAVKNVPGGTAPPQVKNAIEDCRLRLIDSHT